MLSKEEKEDLMVKVVDCEPKGADGVVACYLIISVFGYRLFVLPYFS